LARVKKDHVQIKLLLFKLRQIPNQEADGYASAS
jgi:hypothetical protein